ncbi:MAG: hypothetical protein Q8Q07_07355 [Dehalococcoidales bacterium]|nr:hypothetical protein [Dehalococcoidales bacterium]MDZ4230331.1 hypothetical protein [Dehalococcoidales bacterium]
MAKQISGEEAAELAKAHVRNSFDALPGLEATFERRGKVWVVAVKGGLPPVYRQFKVHVDASNGKVTKCVEIS